MSANKLIQSFNQSQMDKVNAIRSTAGFVVPAFRPGDLIHLEMVVSEQGQTQAFEGRCIAKRNRGLHSSFTLRKMSGNHTGVEIVVPLYSPMIKQMNVVRTGKVRKSKLYYMRTLSAKESRLQTR